MKRLKKNHLNIYIYIFKLEPDLEINSHFTFQFKFNEILSFNIVGEIV